MEIRYHLIHQYFRLWYMRHAIACACLRTCLKHWRHAKKSTPCLIKKASRHVADCPSKKQRFYLSFSVKHKDLTRKSCVFICYFIDSVVKIVLSEAATGGVLYKKVFLKFKIFTGKHKARISFLISLQAPLTYLLRILT